MRNILTFPKSTAELEVDYQNLTSPHLRMFVDDGEERIPHTKSHETRNDFDG